MILLGNKGPDKLIPESQRQEYWEECRDFIEKYAIWKMGPWYWSRGIPAKNNPKSRYTSQYYCSRATGDYNINNKLSILALDALLPIWKKKKFQLAGLESDGTPIAMGMLYTAQQFDVYKDLTMFRVRKEYKEYGLLNLIEGRPNRRPVLMVDDLVSSKKTAYMAWKRLKYKEKMKMANHMFAIIQKEIRDKSDNIDKPKHPVTHEPIISEKKQKEYDVATINLFYTDDFSTGRGQLEIEELYRKATGDWSKVGDEHV